MAKTFEDAILELEKIVTDLENGDRTLDESMKMFEEGIWLSKYCSNILDTAEKKIVSILEENGEILEEDL